MWSSRSMTGFTTRWVSGWPHQSRIWSAVTGDRVFSTRRAWSVPCCRCARPGRGGRGGTDRGRASPRSPSWHRCRCRRRWSRSRASWRRASSPAASGAAYVQRLLTPQVGQVAGDGADGVVEVEGVGQVQLTGDVAGAGEGDVVVVDGEVTTVGGVTAALLGQVGHEPADRLIDQPRELGGLDPVRDRCDVGVDEPGGLDAQGVADGLVGDLPGLPRRQVTRDDPRPQLREPVAQLQGVTEVVLPRLGAHPDRGRELRHAELRHQRRTRTRQRHPASPPPRSRNVSASSRVSAGWITAHCTAACSRSASARSAAARRSTRERQHPGRGVRKLGDRGAGHGSIQAGPTDSSGGQVASTEPRPAPPAERHRAPQQWASTSARWPRRASAAGPISG